MRTATFRETVALVAAKARTILPVSTNGRIESAVKLVLGHDVMPQEDGSILVGSSTDPLKTYRLVGTTCPCQDFERGQAPEGWCQHRIAAGIAKRVTQVLAPPPVPVVPDHLPEPWPDNDPEEPPPAPPAPPAPPPLPEAPASCNVYVTISRHKVQVTLRDQDEQRMLARLATLLQQYPAPEPTARPEGWCAVHAVQMTQTTKEGRTWWSHRVEGGQWCKGRRS